MTARHLSDIADTTDHLPTWDGPYTDWIERRRIPFRAIVSLRAKQIYDHVTHQDKRGSLDYVEWVNLGLLPIATRDMDYVGLGLEYEVPESYGWGLTGIVAGVTVLPVGVTFLGTSYHDYWRLGDTDHTRRLASLQLSAAWRRVKTEDSLTLAPHAAYSAVLHDAYTKVYPEFPASTEQHRAFTWNEGDPVAGIVVRNVDSREYKTTGHPYEVSPAIRDEYLAYYDEKVRTIGTALENASPGTAEEWDVLNPRDVADGYVFPQLHEPPGNIYALLLAKWQAKQRHFGGKKDEVKVNKEIKHAYIHGELMDGEYVLPDIGQVATVTPMGKKGPKVQYKPLDVDEVG